MSVKQLYWVSQISGWMIYILLIWLINRLDQTPITLEFYANLLLTFGLGVILSHAYREVIIRLNWLKLKIAPLIPRVLIASILFGTTFYFFHILLAETLIISTVREYESMVVLKSILNLTVNFVIWSLLYFLFHFIQNYRKEEIKNLEWEAHSREMELNRLKSQMNPHFIFNAMNTIRALVKDNPDKAKQAITQLSNILRNSMLSNKNKVIPLSEELQLVKDYLSIEKTRFEERLNIEIDCSDELLQALVPPLIIQTLVENGIKHGISRLPEGGTLKLFAEKIEKGKLRISVVNDGHYDYASNQNQTGGFGIANSKKRIELLYGDEGSFKLESFDENRKVRAEVCIPRKPKNAVKKLRKIKA